MLSDHSFHKKWAVLENHSPEHHADGVQSYLQFDLAIISRDGNPKPAIFQIRDYDNVEWYEQKLFTSLIRAKFLKFLTLR